MELYGAVLGYLHKEVQVAEIQTAGEFEGHWLKNLTWVEGQDNPADWTIKPQPARELRKGGF